VLTLNLKYHNALFQIGNIVQARNMGGLLLTVRQ
jgi:hypothetical protein